MTRLLCHCDHCPNSTCITQEAGLCYAGFSLDKNGGIEKTTNCFNHDGEFLQSLICDGNITRTSNTIYRCCKTEDFCNERKDFMPSVTDVRQQLLELQKSVSKDGDGNKYEFAGYSFDGHAMSGLTTKTDYPLGSFSEFSDYISDQYSSSSWEMRLVFLLLIGLLLTSVISLVQHCLNRRKSSHSNCGRVLRVHHHHLDVEDCSENSSGKGTADVAVYDTNSMASREPLIANACNLTQCTNQIYNSNQQPQNNLIHHCLMKSPYVSEDTCNSKAVSTLQMSIGPADVSHKIDTSTGSGSGLPYLNRRSIAHDIALSEVIGRGFFGVVYRGEYRGEPVAVKIFSATAEPSWAREAEIYQTNLLRHKNILGFIATDKRDDVSTGYWLVTDYYPMGSLFDFLKTNSLAMPDALRMAFSIANGLAHLHAEIFGTQGKPAIAHRDIKSKNILVKNDGTCCIADLGMAVRYSSLSGIVDVPSNSRVGTRRYLAPELLSDQLNLMDFEAVKATDIYALGLVFWELLRRTCIAHPPDTIEPSSSFEQRISLLQEPDYSGRQHRSPGSIRQGSTLTAQSSQIEQANEKQIPNQLQQQQQASLPQPKQSSSESNTLQQEQEFKSPEHSSPHLSPSPTSSNRPPSASNLNQVSAVNYPFDDPTNQLAIQCDPYEAPYQEFISVDPTIAEMREIVCQRKLRPSVSLRWTKFSPMNDYCTLMRECWYEKPPARLTALRTRKTLGDIAKHYFNLNMEYD